MADVDLCPITEENWLECAMLTMEPGEERFVAPNIWGIAERQFSPALVTRAIYHGNTMVGFVMYYYRDRPDTADPVMGNAWQIVRFMIAVEHRHQGFGRAAIHAVIEEILRTPDRHECDTLLLSYRPGNDAAARLYTRLGFEEVGVGSRNQIIMRRSLRS